MTGGDVIPGTDTGQGDNTEPKYVEITRKSVRKTVAESVALSYDISISRSRRDCVDRIRNHHRLKVNSVGSCWSRK